MDKVVNPAAEAVADILTGAVIACGGFGFCGIPAVLIDALVERGITVLEIISNNCGTDGVGLGTLLENKQIRRVLASTPGRTGSSPNYLSAGPVVIDPPVVICRCDQAAEVPIRAGVPRQFVPRAAAVWP